MLDRAPPGEHDDDAEPDVIVDDEESVQRRVCCGACGHALALPRNAIEVDGQHEHACVNPASIVFRVRCFSEADGVVPVGQPSTYWSWFEGMAWRIATCEACMQHIGWTFEGSERRFVGLIADRIVER